MSKCEHIWVSAGSQTPPWCMSCHELWPSHAAEAWDRRALYDALRPRRPALTLIRGGKP